MTRIASAPHMLVALMVFSVALAASTPLRAECLQWKIVDDWWAKQSNGFTAFLEFDSDQSNGLHGGANYVVGGDRIYGNLHGSIKGSVLKFTIFWQNSSVGVYEGSISQAGLIEGITYDRNNPDVTASFHSDTNMPCVKRVKSTPAPGGAPLTPPSDMSSQKSLPLGVTPKMNDSILKNDSLMTKDRSKFIAPN